jgi:hypothetical protein
MAWREFNLSDGIIVSVSTYYEVVQADPTGESVDQKIRKQTTTTEWRGLTLESAQEYLGILVRDVPATIDGKITPIGGGGYNLSVTQTETIENTNENQNP